MSGLARQTFGLARPIVISKLLGLPGPQASWPVQGSTVDGSG